MFRIKLLLSIDYQLLTINYQLSIARERGRSHYNSQSLASSRRSHYSSQSLASSRRSHYNSQLSTLNYSFYLF
ncbi:MAG: hypothetical protein ACRC62_27955 [Microcoleus sp.]